ncbi:LytR/AlgR family response regulator transcription factor [Dyadobacter fermentans]|uniref:Two component transcriptional regulator, LytTR family n=1 Tax=Dyadobacter fermentans (strain ATCC 700827 / DSM 18053 / CIP 107007 / KCTC 52180 / NS114) TaxID=471854 RepID=C6VRL8_DYAFD|nr:LytTR family DNA-binding domain-containing protein [Dyadobacter fermentans]ACT92721.1 two component transcriptional regulator, LytTR family [Dyadobacter fermentans DSM 18053]
MKIVIIEDEIKTARSLAQLITTLRPDAEIAATIQSVERAISYLTEMPQPDLIFMDIQLSDGLCFEIFESVKVVPPVIFCTAYDHYAIEAFKANGIDYLLKPFKKEHIEGALSRLDQLKSYFSSEKPLIPDLEMLLKRLAGPEGKKSFLVFKQNKYITIKTDTIAFFYIHNETTWLRTFENQDYTISQPLEDVQATVAAAQFYRLNRQYLVNFDAVKEVEHYFSRKLYIKLSVPTPEKLLIGKEKVSHFLGWLENR